MDSEEAEQLAQPQRTQRHVVTTMITNHTIETAALQSAILEPYLPGKDYINEEIYE